MAFSDNGRFLYVLNSGSHDITAFFQHPFTGRLTRLQTTGDLPDGANGLVAR